MSFAFTVPRSALAEHDVGRKIDSLESQQNVQEPKASTPDRYNQEVPPSLVLVDLVDQGPIGRTPSPIDRVPMELIASFIRASLPPYLDHSGRRIFQTLRTVCADWRRICFSTPDLWTSLYLDLKQRNVLRKPSRHSYAARLRGWFSRAGPNLHLRLCLRGLGISLTDAEREGIMHLFKDNVSRWGSLRLDLPIPDLNQLLFSWQDARVDSKWTSLHDLECYHEGPYVIQTSDPGGLIQNLKYMPHLRSLGLKADFLEYERPPTVALHTLLQELNIIVKVLTWRCLEAAQKFPSLTKLTLRLVTQILTSNDFDSKTCTFERLESLTWHTKRSSVDALKLIQCPALQRLSLNLRKEPSLEPDPSVASGHIDAIRGFVGGSPGGLRSFAVFGLGLTDEEIQELLQATPSIRHLQLERWPYLVEAPSELLPHIEVLQVLQVGAHGIEDGDAFARKESFVAYLDQRWDAANMDGAGRMSPPLGQRESPTVGKIRQVILRKEMFVSFFPHDEIEKLRRKGMDIVVIQPAAELEL